MSSYRQHLYHIVFRTKDSLPTIKQDHHKKISFEEEFRKLLLEYGITPDEKYFP